MNIISAVCPKKAFLSNCGNKFFKANTEMILSGGYLEKHFSSNYGIHVFSNYEKGIFSNYGNSVVKEGRAGRSRESGLPVR